jgi:hypothetical protein
MICLFWYFKFGFTTSISKVTMDGTPIVVTIVGGLMKCKLQATLWNPPCNPSLRGDPPKVSNGLPNFQSEISGVKTHWLEKFFISLENYWNVDVLDGLAVLIWTSKMQVMAKRRSGSQIIKSQGSTRFTCVQAACDILLESSKQGLQHFFRPHRNQRFERKVMGSQSHKSPNGGTFGIPTWESQDKKPFGCGFCGEV